MQNNIQISLNQDKINFDSNKENFTPSSYLSSNSKMLSHQKMWTDNNLKHLRTRKEDLLNLLDTNDTEYYRLLKKKEDLMYKVMERDSILFKEKAELEYMNDIMRERENRKIGVTKNSDECGNIWLENYLLSENFFTIETGNSNQIHIKLNNDLALVGKKGKEGITCTGLINTKMSTGNSNINEILHKEFDHDQELLMLYAAYNVV